jgi:hypothetical protein
MMEIADVQMENEENWEKFIFNSEIEDLKKIWYFYRFDSLTAVNNFV